MAMNKNRLFAYPVLTNYNDDYVNVKLILESTKTLEKTKKSSKLSYIFQVDDFNIIKLVKERKAKAVLKIYCPTTKYRKMVDLTLGVNNIILNNVDVNNRVELESFIILTVNVKQFCSVNFNKDYQDDTFDLEKGSIIAVGKQESVFIEKDIYEFTKVTSVIKVRKSTTDEKGMTVDYSDQNIYVYLPEDEYIIYSQYAKHCLEVANSMVILPALTFVFDELSKDDDAFNEYEDNKWFRVIKRKVKDLFDQEFNSNFIKAAGSLLISQKILDFPLEPGFEWIKDKID